MSTIVGTNIEVTNIKYDSDTTAMIVSSAGGGAGTVPQGLAKAFSSINGASTAATRGTFNMSSLNDNGTGNYTITITNPMANTNYTGHFSSGDHDDTSDSFTRQFTHTLNTSYLFLGVHFSNAVSIWSTKFLHIHLALIIDSSPQTNSYPNSPHLFLSSLPIS